jgi:hypothetical protein
MNKNLFFIVWCLSVQSFAPVSGNIRMVRTGESCPNSNVVLLSGQEQLSGQAFQQDALLSHNGYQYTVYYNNDRNVCIARRKLPLGEWHEVVLPHRNTADDSHNVISMGVCANDGTIHLAYDHHNTTLQYCRSVIGLASNPEGLKWSAGSFGATTSQLVAGITVPDVTYPRFISKPDGNLLFECRYKLSGDGDSYLREYSGETHQWTLIGRYVQGMDANPNACAYINRMDYDCLGRLHVSWCWRDDYSGMSNHDIFYGYSDDHGRSWKDTNGNPVALTEAINPTDSRTSGECMRQGIASLKIAGIACNRGYINQESQTGDRQGRVHILNSYMPDDAGTDTNWSTSRIKARLHHRFRDADGAWKVNQVKKQGTAVYSYCRSQIIADAFDNTFVIANGAEIYAATSAGGYADWELVSDVDNGRFCSEPQVDHPRLLNDGVLSFVYVGRDKKVVVIDYLTDNPVQPFGSGLRASYYSDKGFGNEIASVENVLFSTTDIPAATKSIVWSGTMETLYGEQYTLYLDTDVPAEVYVDGRLLLRKTAVGREEISADMPLIASHKHAVTVKAEANPSATVNLLWSGAHTAKASVPQASFYPETVRQDDKDNPYPYSPDLQEKTELPVILSEGKTVEAGSESDYLTLPIDPDGDYSVEVNFQVLSAEGRGMDVDARTGNGAGFRFSVNTDAAYWSAPLTAMEQILASDNRESRSWRFAVRQEKVYAFYDGKYVAGKDLATWIGNPDAAGNESEAPQCDAENLIAGWDGEPGNDDGRPTDYGWGCTASAPWNTANGNSGVRYMDVASGHTLPDESLYSGRLVTVRWDGAELSGAYYYLPVTLEERTSYRFSFLGEWWSNSQGGITAAVSTLPNASGIIADKTCSPALRNVLYEEALTFRTGNGGIYYLMFTGGSGMMAGIGALSLNRIQDTPRLIVGKNYPTGSAHIRIHSVTYDDSGAFSPGQKTVTGATALKQAKASVSVFSKDNVLHIEQIPPHASVFVYDMMGQLRVRQYVAKNTLSVSLSSGAYLLVLRSGNELYREKVVVR